VSFSHRDLHINFVTIYYIVRDLRTSVRRDCTCGALHDGHFIEKGIRDTYIEPLNNNSSDNCNLVVS